MDVHITSRHFKARPSLQEHINGALEKLAQVYDGIVSAQVVLEIEAHNEGKVAEIVLLVYHDSLIAKESGDEFEKCISACVDKLERQLRKYKDKLHRGRGLREQDETVMRGE